MCDPLSLASAGSSLIGGFTAAADARAASSFQMAQINAMKHLASARSSREEGVLRRSYAEHAGANIAAAAVTGLAHASFEGIQEGNRKDMQRNLRVKAGDLHLELVGLETQKQVARIEGRIRSTAALMSGFTQAASTLYDAEMAFRQYHHRQEGTTRTQNIMDAFRRRD